MPLRRSVRRAGVLLHPTSLPSVFGIGDFGPSAYAFVDWLVAAGQSMWQVLPLVQPDLVGSPYASSSAFAGNWLLISPELLARDGWLESVSGWSRPDERVSYPTVARRKARVLEQAFAAFVEQASPSVRRDFAAYRRRERAWLDDVTLFAALKEHFGPDVPWTRWPDDIRNRHARSLRRWRRRLQSRIDFHAFCQWQFDRQWRALKRYANRRGIAVIGDLPLFVTRDSADTWAQPKNFLLDSMGRPRLVAGVPPDYFSRRGQVWGDPLYDWTYLRQHKFGWWRRRFQRSFQWYDVVRLDHFRGYVSVWGIRAKSRSARHGAWHHVPGAELLVAMKRKYGSRFISEDLGIITDDVVALRNRLEFPGVRVAQFGFDRLDSIHTIENFSRRAVAYTGTHDNNASRGWIVDDASRRERRFARRLIGGSSTTFTSRLMQRVFASRAETVIIPLPDILNLGSEARLNTPGTRDGNWQWRFTLSALTRVRQRRLLALTRATRRRNNSLTAQTFSS